MLSSLMKALTIIVAVTLSAGLYAAEAEEGGERLKSLFGDNDAQDVVAKPTNVQAYRLADRSLPQQKVKDYKMVAGPVAVDDKLAKSMSRVLLDEKSYSWGGGPQKACVPIYGVRLEFIQGDNTTDVFFCFECNILGVYVNGKEVRSADFDHARPQFVKLVKKILPEDKEIQGLKE